MTDTINVGSRNRKEMGKKLSIEQDFDNKIWNTAEDLYKILDYGSSAKYRTH